MRLELGWRSCSTSKNRPGPEPPQSLQSCDENRLLYRATWRGESVAVLVEGHQPAGYHTAFFDAGRLASGVYVYRLRAGSFLAQRKMLLVK